MSRLYNYRILALLVLLLSFTGFDANASHLMGGEMTYVYLGDSTAISGVWHRYRITLTIYEDCQNGQPEAIAEDNPAFTAIYDAGTNNLVRADSVYFGASYGLSSVLLGPCPALSPSTCILKKTFNLRCAVKTNSNGYIVNYQRCCMDGKITNIISPSDNGVTFCCFLPPSPNNSAVFKKDPPRGVQLNRSFSFDHSAVDPDGDSLSYELCSALLGADNTNIKPFPPTAPPFDSVTYIAPFTGSQPLGNISRISMDPITGQLSGTPDLAGLYLVTVCCHEWRAGVLINTVRREMQIKVEASPQQYKPSAGGDVVLVVGDTFRFQGTNADTYLWSPPTYLDNATNRDPLGHFTDAGTFTYILYGTYTGIGGTCEGNDTVKVTVIDHSGVVVPAAFTPNGDGKNDFLYVLPIGRSAIVRFRIFNRKGNLVFDGGPNEQWDGTYHGQRQDLGTYFWEVNYIDNTGKSRLAKGDVTLVR